MKGGDIAFHGGAVFLIPEKIQRLGAGRRRLERNPFLEPLPGLLTEAPDERSQWRARARKFLRACYNEAKGRLGEDEARALFVEAPPKRKRGHQEGETGRPGLFEDRNARLLAAYDEWARGAQTERERGAIPRQLAERLYAAGKGARYGASVDAIARHLRRLLKARAPRAAESAEQHRRLLEAYKATTGEDLRSTLLSSALADNK